MLDVDFVAIEKMNKAFKELVDIIVALFDVFGNLSRVWSVNIMIVPV